jgi:hypothetical protein
MIEKNGKETQFFMSCSFSTNKMEKKRMNLSKNRHQDQTVDWIQFHIKLS